MAKAPVTVAKNKKGKDKAEYPKLVPTAKGKVRVNSAEEEAALDAPAIETKGWKK